MKGDAGIKVRMMDRDGFERLCLERDVFTIRQQNSFINVASRTFLNVAGSWDAFSREFDRLSANLDEIHLRLTNAISVEMDHPEIISEEERQRYHDMVEHMTHAVMNYRNKRVAFLTYKIVEETVKRAVLKVSIEKLLWDDLINFD